MDNQPFINRVITDHYKSNFSQLVSRYRQAAGSKHNAEDAVQEAYLRAWKYAKTYDEKLGFNNWFNSILSNCIRDRQKEDILNGMVQENLAPFIDPPRITAIDIVISNEIKQRINALPFKTGYILTMYLFEGYTSKEISEFTEYSTDAIRKIVSRFRAELVEKETEDSGIRQ